METRNINTKWWQRPQPAWVTALISMVGMLLVLGLWTWGQPHLAAQEEMGVQDIQAVSSDASTMNYQGYVTGANGQPLNGNHNLTFRLYDSSSGGTALWTENHTNVPANNGFFNVLLGSKTDGGIPDTLWQNPLYLETVLDGEILSPRESVQLGIADKAITVSDGAITASKFAPDAFPNSTGHVHYSETIPLGATYQTFTSTNVPITVSQRSNILIAAKGTAITSGSGGYFAGICHNGDSSPTGETHLYTPNISDAPPFEKFSWAWIDTVEAGTYTYSICAGNGSGTNVTLQWYRPTISLVSFPAP